VAATPQQQSKVRPTSIEVDFVAAMGSRTITMSGVLRRKDPKTGWRRATGVNVRVMWWNHYTSRWVEIGRMLTDTRGGWYGEFWCPSGVQLIKLVTLPTLSYAGTSSRIYGVDNVAQASEAP
jgi:hypothetical protein